MSEPMNSGVKPRPSAAKIAPAFPAGRLLPTDPKQLAGNIKRQKRDEIAFGNQQRKLLQAKGDTHSGIPCCKVLHISMTFDGTNNNNEADSASNPSSCSNMARLYHASLGLDDITRGRDTSVITALAWELYSPTYVNSHQKIWG
ncbi:hypothetical protein [Pseudomonas sp. S1Bt23]|uniref:hypothetical protein n=1 Tax=Pseudomonas sp. S1Bt23 TaxID=3095074 RepID=UPI002A59E8BF|nr:hypothetical protein [Pseudomonas sp. S1Bt23]WPO47380.1 hypothetical protein SHB59_29775 [Pseudomonas sp. S1Bt23]